MPDSARSTAILQVETHARRPFAASDPIDDTFAEMLCFARGHACSQVIEATKAAFSPTRDLELGLTKQLRK